MQPALSTHVFLQQRLHPGLLDALHKSGAQTIEIFAARHHFDYNDRSAVRDIATWFRSTGVAATLHQPLYFSDRGSGQWSRHVAPNINLIDPEKSHRITAMDEVKRALESAEQVPIDACVLHLGHKGDPWDTRALENSLTAFEHLKPRIAQLHLHDNHGTKDEHLWPGSGSIDWTNIAKQVATLPANTPGILEIAHDLEETPDSATTKATQAFDLL